MKRSELTCDQCGEVQPEEMAKFYRWFRLVKVKTFDVHFCSVACLTAWLDEGHADGKPLTEESV